MISRSDNGRAAVAALREPGFRLSDDAAAQIERRKDFVQPKDGPFDPDLIFGPDGIERFDDAWQRRVDVDGFPACHIDDIIAGKLSTNRRKHRESLPRLQSFAMYWKEHRA